MDTLSFTSAAAPTNAGGVPEAAFLAAFRARADWGTWEGSVTAAEAPPPDVNAASITANT